MLSRTHVKKLNLRPHFFCRALRGTFVQIEKTTFSQSPIPSKSQIIDFSNMRKQCVFYLFNN